MAAANQATSSRIAGRHHLVSPGDIISESAGDFVGICTVDRLKKAYRLFGP